LRECAIDGCEEWAKANGLCVKHYNKVFNQKRKPNSKRTPTTMEEGQAHMIRAVDYFKDKLLNARTVQKKQEILTKLRTALNTLQDVYG
jgi:hypothetical protein